MFEKNRLSFSKLIIVVFLFGCVFVLAHAQDRVVDNESGDISGLMGCEERQVSTGRKLASLSINKKKPDKIKKYSQYGAIGLASSVGVLALYGASYWHNTQLKKPWLDCLFQRFALLDREKTNRKFDNNPKEKGGEIISNLMINTQVYGRHATVEAHVVDGDNTLPRDGAGDIRLEESVLNGKPDKEKLVVLYIPGLGEDVRSYQYRGEKKGVGNPMQLLSQEIQLPIVTMNSPPFGRSRIEGSDRYDLDENFEAAKVVVEKIATLYNIPTCNIIPWSWCVGGNAAARIAAEYKARALILDAVPTAIDDISLPVPIIQQGLRVLKPFILSRPMLDLTASIKKLDNTQILIRHRCDDTVVNKASADRFLKNHTIISATEPARDPFKRAKGEVSLLQEIFCDPNFRYKTGHYLKKPDGKLLNRWLDTVK